MKKNLLHIIAANIFYLIIVAGTNFILPKFTSIETYSAIKEYTLYLTTYSSILTLGYLQGMYIEYGGKELEHVDPREIGLNIVSFFALMLPISVAISFVGVCMHNVVITALGIGILSTNMLSYYQMLYQATGDFKDYGNALNISRVTTFASYLILIFIVKTDNQILFVGTMPLVCVASAVYQTIRLHKKVPFLSKAGVSFKTIIKNLRNGFVLMLGDFVTKFFSSLDRWFVKILMNTFSFAMYSFAVSMENLVNTFMTPVTVSMYNYFCKKPETKDVRRMKDAALIYSFVIIAGAYPAKWILEVFITEYIDANIIIFPLFAAQGIGAVIKGIYVNKYKAEGKQEKYLFQMITMLVLAFVLNIVFYLIHQSAASFAVATLLTNIIWLLLCEFQNKDIRYSVKTAVGVIILLTVYMLTGNLCNSIIGCAIYCVSGVLVGVLLMRDSFLFVINSLFGTIKKKLFPAK